MPTILITGSSSGLGLAFLKHYASLPNTSILALDVSPPPPDIARLPNVEFSVTDITSPISIPVEQRESPLHLLIHCAGVRGLVPDIVKNMRGNVAAAETMSVMDKETMMKTLEINCFGAFNVLQTFLPRLLEAALSTSKADPPKIVVMSSRMGSVASNAMGGGYAYRASKAALNAVVKSFSVDFPDVVFLAMHPGRVETGLVEWKEEGAISPEETLVDCVKVIQEAGPDMSGKFVDRWGKDIPW
ncbi:hypothetical protein BCR34DRAFT_621859 [Clohesyomyces aquaticus]|uniref:NAD(P)-binding protein n=1 Tax=Clohesyomyces aquaticus TaxID=1231657 RepID=A0A1Y2A4H3_9PLEO|nr:hypothetical protein BCR34DRAFT_621859 [Clohesyomyces aquaticus]